MTDQQKPADKFQPQFRELAGGVIYASSVGEVATVQVDNLTTEDASTFVKVILAALNAHDWTKP